MAKTLWFDNTQHYLLVDEHGAPYLSEDCPCSRGVCWQRFEASCIDENGSPVYGDQGTGNVSQAHWDTPVMERWVCRGTNDPTDWGVLNKWVQDSPGFAHIWKKTDLAGADCKVDCSVPRAVAKPDLPCSCNPIWSTINHPVTAPNYSYYVTKWKFMGWQVNGNASTLVSSEIRPMWELSDFVRGGVYDKVTGTKYSSTRSYYFLGNFVKGSLDSVQSWCGSDASEGSAWSDYKKMQDTWSYLTYSVTGVSGASGYYVRLPNESIWGHRNGSNAWVEDGKLYVISSYYKDPEAGTSTLSCCISEIENPNMTTSWTSYTRVHEMPFSTSFASDQWGHLEAAVTHGEHIHPYIVREARGAQVNRLDIDIQTTAFVTGRYEGSPLWFYRTYCTTDWDLPQVNYDNWIYALSGTGENTSLVREYITAPGVFCPQYWYLYITWAWTGCTQDSAPRGLPFTSPAEACPPGTMCQFKYTYDVAPDGRDHPEPYWGRYEYSMTDWKHEVDESLDQNGQPVEVPGLRTLNASTDEHAYRVSKLEIRNYPTWYSEPMKCAVSLNGEYWEIPQVDLSDSAWFRRRGCYGSAGASSWPAVFDSCVETSAYCAFYKISEVLPQEVPENGKVDSWYMSQMMYDFDCYRDSDGYLVFPTSYIAEWGHGGCPGNLWSCVLFWSDTYYDECCVTSGGVSEWVEVPAENSLHVSTEYEGTDGRGGWSFPHGSLTWQGNIPNSDLYCLSHQDDSPRIIGAPSAGEAIVESEANHIKKRITTGPGLWVYQYTYRNTCDSRSCFDIEGVARYAIKNGVDKVTYADCDSCVLLHDGDQIDVVMSARMTWSKTIENHYEHIIDNGSSPNHIEVTDELIGMTPEIIGGTVDYHVEQDKRMHLEFTVDWQGVGSMIWHESDGYNFNVHLDDCWLTRTWVTDFNNSLTYSYTMSETVSSEVWSNPDDGTVFSSTWGGRQYNANGWQSAFTVNSPVEEMVSLTTMNAHITRYWSDGVCELRIENAWMPMVDYPLLEETYAPSFPGPQLQYWWSQDWTPANSPFTVSNEWSAAGNGFYDSYGSYEGSMWWHYNSDSGSASNTSSKFESFELPVLTNQTRAYAFWERPELISPCAFRGRDVLDSYPYMVTSSGRNMDGETNATDYNSGEGSGWDDSTTYLISGVQFWDAESWYNSWYWDWHGEIGASAGETLLTGN